MENQKFKNPYELLKELEAYFSFRTRNIPSSEILDIKESINYTLRFEPHQEKEETK